MQMTMKDFILTGYTSYGIATEPTPPLPPSLSRASTLSLPLLSARTIVVSQFSGSTSAGTLYVGGDDAHDNPAHKTDWI